MTKINLPYNLQDGQRAYAAKVMADFQAIIEWANAGAGSLDVEIEGMVAKDVQAALMELLTAVLDRYTKAESDDNLAGHTERTDNPHEVTATQTAYDGAASGLSADNTQLALDAIVAELYNLISRDKGAPASIAGISNAGGDIELDPGVGILVTKDPVTKKITITATGESIPAPHAHDHEAGGADALTAHIAYDNAASKAKANTLQGATDELFGEVKTLKANSRTSFERIVTGRWVL